MSRVIDGKCIASRIKDLIKKEIKDHLSALRPGLAIVQVGRNPASNVYVAAKIKQAEDVGIDARHALLDETVSEQDIVAALTELNGDASVNGIILQLPLPKGIDTKRCLNTIDPSKDVDGLTLVNAGNLSTGLKGFVPCTPLGCVLLLRQEIGDLDGKHVAIVGRSNLVGKPLAQLLLNQNCTVTVVHSQTKNPSDLTKQADILISAAGQPQMIDASWVKSGAVVLDVGTTQVQGQLRGDVQFDAVKDKVHAITPVPGGVGPMTVACLLFNTVLATARQAKIDLKYLTDDPLQVLS